MSDRSERCRPAALLRCCWRPRRRRLRAGPPAEPSVAAMQGGVGEPGGELADPGRQQPRHPPARGLRLRPPDRLRPRRSSWCRTSPERSTSRTAQRFTFHLRAGHRWSDGAPFTTEDFRYWWEDIANNPAAQPGRAAARSPGRGRAADGRDPGRADRALFLVASPTRSSCRRWPARGRCSSTRPPTTSSSSTSATPSPAELARLVEADRARDWAQLHGRRDDMYRFDNPDLPTLQPWVMRTRPPAERFIAERNPYFHRVDRAGQQLPYIDRVILDVVDDRLIPVKTGAGETDLQARGLAFKDYTFLKQSEAHNDLQHDALADRARRPPGALPQPQRRPTRSGARCSATSASAARCRSASTATTSTRPSISASASAATTASCRRARCTSREYRFAWAELRPGRGQPPARRDRPAQARRPRRRACCRTAGRWT